MSTLAISLVKGIHDKLFELGDEEFSFVSQGVTLTVMRLEIQGWVAFRVTFSSGRQPIVIAKAKGRDQPEFWTSIPEGRQQEAEGVGKLIEEHLQQKS